MNYATKYTAREEIANALTHALGVVLGIFGLILMLQQSLEFGTAWHVTACAIYGVSLILLYMASTAYHAAPPGGKKRLFQKLDHAGIFVLIAGTYTPFTLISLSGVWGWSIFAVVWGLAIIGLYHELFARKQFPRLALGLYLVMGWMMMIAIKPMMDAVPSGGLWLLLAGGLSYTAGVVFYVRDSLPYHHAIWHLFVLGGSVCHFLAILLYVLPRGT